jgi:hypothetical protein
VSPLITDSFSSGIVSTVRVLLKSVEPGVSIVSVTPTGIGGNNRTYRVATSAGTYLAKEYFTHAGDQRNRLTGEYQFCQYASCVAAGMSPRPIAKDDRKSIALYDFIEGRHFFPGAIDVAEVDQAVAFFQALNAPDARERAFGLPFASEAVFSIEAHLKLIDQRMLDLLAIAENDNEDRLAKILIHNLYESWLALIRETTDRAGFCGLDVKVELAEGQRCISPSDFGFHNAVLRPDGGICFLDFEYAGWDDPARMVGDFFSQLSVPVPARYFDHFVERCLKGFPDSESLRYRALLLRPIYQVKWCCIALALFLPVNMARRKFANPDMDEAAAKRTQLKKAEDIFQTIRMMPNGLH